LWGLLNFNLPKRAGKRAQFSSLPYHPLRLACGGQTQELLNLRALRGTDA
jgi:hypothetical protein